MSKTVDDDINFTGCPYTDAYNSYYFQRNETYSAIFDYLVPTIRAPVCTAFSVPESEWSSVTFPRYYDLTDALMAEDKEGDPKRYPFTQEEWYYIREVQKYALTMPFAGLARQLFITK